MDDLARVRVVVTGVVQGVGYRYFAMHLARDYGIRGWVRNREDGVVELEAEAEGGIVESYLKDLRIGPRSAEVTGLDVAKIPPLGTETGFSVRF
jgi:acylphosphatase